MDFYGDKKIVEDLADKFGGWHGEGFWGIGNADGKMAEEVQKFVEEKVNDRTLQIEAEVYLAPSYQEAQKFVQEHG